MDFPRSILIGAIAIFAVMLLTRWVDFKESHTPDSPAVATSGDLIPQLPDTSIGQPQATSRSEDLPETPAETVTKSTTPDTDIATDQKLVHIQTDVLQLTIDLHGGDITELSLPAYPEQLDTPDKPFPLLERNNRQTYIAQSGLIGPDGIDKKGRAEFVTNAPQFQLDDGKDELVVDLKWTDNQGINIIKRFTFHRGDYLVTVEYLVDNHSEHRWQANLFGQIKRDSNPPPTANHSSMGLKPFLGFATTLPDDHFQKFTFKKLKEEPFKAQITGGWIAMIQHYFLSAWIPAPDQTHNYRMRVTSNGFNIGGFTSPALVLDPGQSGQVSAGFYAGPKNQSRLREISPYLDLSVDYGWLWWIAQPLFWLLTKIHALVGNWGFSIILLTVLIKAGFYKLSAASYKSMANMRRMQPKMQDIREQYADDKQKQSQAMMELYRKEKINPLGGCLPVLVQMPVFLSLYWMLMESVELRQAPFILWIRDLSVMDPYFVLPLIMGASMYFMQKLNPPPPDPMQAKIMQWMPVMFTFFFLWFPSGLVLYWVVNNLLSMTQQYVITRQIEAAYAKT